MTDRESFREAFWKIISGFKHELKIMFALVLALGMITLVSMVLADQATEAYVISVVTLAILGVSGLLIGLCLWRIR